MGWLREDLGGFLGEGSSANTFWVEAMVSKDMRGGLTVGGQ
jgi:hypothetical protein